MVSSRSAKPGTRSTTVDHVCRGPRHRVLPEVAGSARIRPPVRAKEVQGKSTGRMPPYIPTSSADLSFLSPAYLCPPVPHPPHLPIFPRFDTSAASPAQHQPNFWLLRRAPLGTR